jgi:arylsulfatase
MYSPPLSRGLRGSFVLAVLLGTLGCDPASLERIDVDVFHRLSTRVVHSGVVDLSRSSRSQIVVGEGWHAIEPAGRWTAAREAHLRVPLAHGGPGRIAIDVAAWGIGSATKQMTLAVNGFVLPSVRVSAVRETKAFDVPDGVLRIGDNEVVVATESLHEEHRRSLGLFVESVRILPERAPSTGAESSAGLVLGPRSWIEDPRGALVASDLVLRWRSVQDTIPEHAGARLALIEIDAEGRPVRELASATVAGDSGVLHLEPPRGIDAATPGRLVLLAPDDAYEIELVGATRRVPSRDDVLLIVIDTLRADALGCYGKTDAQTPHLDQLARDGTLFLHTIAHAPLTGPSHAALLQSLVPSRAGIVNNHEGRLDPREPTLAELLAARGYQCRSAVSISPIHSRFGFGRGFDEVDEELGLAFLREGETTTTRAERWLADAGTDRPRFTFVHLAEPHEPYEAHGTVQADARIHLGDVLLATIPIADFAPSMLEFDVVPGAHRLRIETDRILQVRRFELLDTAATSSWLESGPPTVVRQRWNGTLHVTRPGRLRLAQVLNDGGIPEKELLRRYALEVEAIDRFVGRLLRALESSGRADRTWVVFTADHGEEIGDHGRVGHVHTLFDEVVRVPLIVRAPAHAQRKWRGRVRGDLAAGVDVLPTVLDVLGIEVPAERNGRSLRTVSAEDRTAWIETHAPQAQRTLFALRSVQEKVIWAPEEDQWRLFDLVEDPRERQDLAAMRPERLAYWQQRMRAAHLRYVADRTRAELVLDPESEAALRSLGYVE